VNWENIQYFSPEEFQCACCGKELMDQHFVEKLDAARDYLQIPFKINSGYRCPEHNKAVSPSTGTTGPHTTGRAADIALSYGDARKALTTLSMRFGGIGIKQHGPRESRFLHVDDLAQRIWTY
jgi:uncharacterized protein YcbK (DUF882 family)